MRLRVNSLPRVSPKVYYSRLIQHIDTGRPLPENWDISIGWRNPNTLLGRSRHWQYDDFENAVSESRGGFITFLRQTLLAHLRRYR